MADWLPIEFGEPETGELVDADAIEDLDWSSSQSQDRDATESGPETDLSPEDDLFAQQTEPDPLPDSGFRSGRASEFIGRADWPEQQIRTPRGRANLPLTPPEGERAVAEVPARFPDHFPGERITPARSNEESGDGSAIRQAGLSGEDSRPSPIRQTGGERSAINLFADKEPQTLEQAQEFPAGVSSAADSRESAINSTAADGPSTEPGSTSTVDEAVGSRSTATAVTEVKVGTEATELNLEQIDAWLESGEHVLAHKEMSKLYWNSPESRSVIMQRLDENARRIYFSPQPHFLDPYVIQSGDFLQRVAPKYRISWQYLSKLNNANPRRIRAGQKLKVIRGPFSAWIDLSEFALTVHCHGFYVKRYPVGIGRDGATPIGRFRVLNKVTNPQYTDPDGRVVDGNDPTNPLGTHWIDLGDSYGIHGTINPDSIGKAESRGCIRLRNADVAEVYDFLINGSEVVIRP